MSSDKRRRNLLSRRAFWRSFPFLIAIVGALVSSVLVTGPASATTSPKYRYYLVEYTDINSNSTSPQSAALGLTGSAWVELLKLKRPASEPNCTVATCPVVQSKVDGFAPADSDAFDTTGAVIDESGHPWTWRIFVPLTAPEYQAALTFVNNETSVGGLTYGLMNAGPLTLQHFGVDLAGTNCMDFVRGVQNAAGLGSAQVQPLDSSGQSQTYKLSPALSDPELMYQGLSSGSWASSFGQVPGITVERNRQPLGVTQPLNPPDFCSMTNLTSAAVSDPQAVARGLGWSYSERSPGSFQLQGSTCPGSSSAECPPFTTPIDGFYNDPKDPASWLMVADWGDGSVSAGPEGWPSSCTADNYLGCDGQFPFYLCGKTQQGDNAYCGPGHQYQSNGPFDAKVVLLMQSAIYEYDVTFTPPSCPDGACPQWKPKFPEPGGEASYCSLSPAQNPSSSSSNCFLRLIQTTPTNHTRNVANKTVPIVVGQKVNLAPQLPDGSTPSGTPTWTVDQLTDIPATSSAVSNFTITDQKTAVRTLGKERLKKSPLIFYFIRPGLFTVQVGIGGSQVGVTFNVVAPKGYMNGRLSCVGIAQDTSGPNLALGYDNSSCPGKAGVSFHLHLDPKTVKGLGPVTGSFDLAQVIEPQASVDQRACTFNTAPGGDGVGFGSDGGKLYGIHLGIPPAKAPGDWQEADNPHLGLSGAKASANESLSAVDYLMFRADPQQTSIWIPLYKMAWGWSGQASKEKGAWTVQASSITPENGVAQGVSSHLLPHWTFEFLGGGSC